MNSIIRRGTAVGLTVAACAWIAGCDNSYLDQSSARSQQPISSATLAEMEKLDTTPSSPTLIRTYKKEAELEIWKMKSNGEYALLKTYPMCRWSGQLGPKKREGDMQVPEGFYSIAPGQMNPNSHYYLAFNVGYPNAYDRAYGRTGGNVMVHGVCSSAGCFSMTDEQVADIYAIARKSFAGGQREIQLQSYPFHMTAENMAKFRLDPNIDFWKNLKDGSDHFEVTKNEPSVLVCGKHYVFDATTKERGFRQRTVPGAQARSERRGAGRGKGAQGRDQGRRTGRVWRQADPPGLRRRRAKSGLHRLQGRKRPGGAGERTAGDRPERPSKPVPAAVKVAVADADKKRVASARAGARRGPRGAAGSGDSRRDSAPAKPVRRDAGRRDRRRQECPEMAASWRPGACALWPSTPRRPMPIRQVPRIAAAAAPRRRAYGVAAYAADPADRPNSAETQADAPNSRLGVAAAIATG